MEIILIALISGIICLALPKRFNILAGQVALVSSFACLCISIRMLFLKGLCVFLKIPALEGLFKIDGLNIFIVPFLGLFGFLITLYSFGWFKKGFEYANEFYSYLLFSVCVSTAVVLANNLLLLFVMWGIGALLLYLLIGINNSQESGDAAKKTIILVGGTDALMMVGIAMLWQMTGTFDIDKIRLALDNPMAIASFLCILTAVLAKAGAMPFHTWIPYCSQSAPAVVMAFLPASLDKFLGIYLLARCVLNIFVIMPNTLFSFFLMIIGAGTIICSVMMALIQHNFRRLLAYHAVSQVGYMVLGIGTATPLGIAAGLFHMLNNAIYKSCLFLTAGNVEEQAGTGQLEKLGGLMAVMPVAFASFLIASLSISGIPPLNGFFSKWMLYQALIQSLSGAGSRWIVLLCLLAAMFGSALTLASFMKLLYAVFLAKPPVRDSEIQPNQANWYMWLPAAFLSLLCVVFGIFAYQLPLKYFIYPAVTSGAVIIGNYAPIRAALLLILGALAGVGIYCAVHAGKNLKLGDSFIGGEILPEQNKVNPEEFYDTISKLGILSSIYQNAHDGVFDIYHQGRKFMLSAGRFLQYMHNGVLPTYLVWALLGMIGLFFAMIR